MKQLLFRLTKNDFNVEFYRASGNGGQNRNKRDTACRITHKESGAVGISADERSQLQNKKKAFERLVSIVKKNRDYKRNVRINLLYIEKWELPFSIYRDTI